MRKVLDSVLWPIPALMFAPVIILFAIGVELKRRSVHDYNDSGRSTTKVATR
jgi:membrane protein required for beta-lactamase induction